MKVEFGKDNIEIVDFSALEAYKIARKLEKDGIEFYRQLLEKNLSAEVSQATGFLLSEEKRHLKLFEDKIFELREKTEDGFEEDALVDSVDTKVFAPFDTVTDLEKYLTDTRRALKLGVAIEKNSLVFYQALLNNLKGAQTKREIELIIKEENSHLAILENLLSK
ncbi:MAG: hypothetical protein ACOY3D_07790 [Candidatus Omnitrophota bacterium]